MAVFRRLLGLALVCLASFSAAQIADQVVAAQVLGPHWRQISRAAGMVFSGTVLGVERRAAGKNQPIPVIVIKFRVDRAIAGIQPGQVLTVREWAGAWSMHRAMRSGQRWLIFLYPASRLGLSSPVGGWLGQVALDSRGEIVRTSAAGQSAEGVNSETSGAEARNQNNGLIAAVNRCATQNLTPSTNCEAGIDPAAFVARLKSCPPEDLAVAVAVPRELRPPAGHHLLVRGDCAVAAQPGSTLGHLERAIRDARKDSSATSARTKE